MHETIFFISYQNYLNEASCIVWRKAGTNAVFGPKIKKGHKGWGFQDYSLISFDFSFDQGILVP